MWKKRYTEHQVSHTTTNLDFEVLSFKILYKIEFRIQAILYSLGYYRNKHFNENIYQIYPTRRAMELIKQH